MALQYSLGPNPKWYFVNKNGKPLSGGLVNTYSSLNNAMRKNVFATPAADFPLPNPFNIDADGTAGPFWFEFNTLDPTNGYLIIVTDANGNEIWTADDYFANSAGGGGSITVGLNLDNLIKNNVFYRHRDTILTPVPTFSVIAPSNFTNLVANTVTAGTNPSPDICFIKDTAAATDTITFPLISPLGDEPIVNDTAPVDYFNYACTVPDGAQQVKCLQFPITAKVQNLSNQPVKGSLWMRANGATPNQQVVVRWFQYFGDGAGASVPVTTTIDTFTILVNNVWDKQEFISTVPDVSGKNLGAPNSQGPNDSLFLQVEFPLTTVCDIGITKPTLYLGTTLPDLDFESYDEIDSIISLPRTGDVRTSMNAFQPFGWVPCNDGVISNGDATIVRPALVPVARNNIDTYPLFSLIWSFTSNYPTFAPIYDSAGTASTRGATAIADFAANKQLSLTRMLGRVLCGANPTLIAAQTFTASIVTSELTVTDATQFPTGTPVLLTNTGGSLPNFVGVANTPPVYYSIYLTATTIKLALSLDFAQSGTALTISGAGSGSNMIQTALGTYFGEGYHLLTAAELPPLTVPGIDGAGGGPPFTAARATNAAPTGTIAVTGPGSVVHNTMQPTAFMNVFLKL